MTSQTLTPEMTEAEATAVWEVLWGPDPAHPADPALVAEAKVRLDQAEAERKARAAELETEAVDPEDARAAIDRYEAEHGSDE